MATYQDKPIVVAAKLYSRNFSGPLDIETVQESLDAAKTYAQSATAYAGQVITVLEDGKYVPYILNGNNGALTLDKVGVDASAIKNYVQVVDDLPEKTNAEQGVIYITTTDSKGYIFNGTDFKIVFEDVTTDQLNDALEGYAPLAGATFTGKVTLSADPTADLEAVTKQYVDRLVANLNSGVPGVVDEDNPLPSTGYKAGASWRVAANGTYAGQQCEVGDLIIAVTEPYAGTGSLYRSNINIMSGGTVKLTDIVIPEGLTIKVGDSIVDSHGDRYKVTAVTDTNVTVGDAQGKESDGFLVVQANIDGAVTGPAAATNANIVVFDGVTGKKIADSAVTIASVKDAVAKAHSHDNKEILDSFNKNQADLLTSAHDDAAKQITDLGLEDKFNAKADADSVYSKTDIDGKLKVINDNLNTKVSADQVSTQISNRVGDIDANTTVKEYIDNNIPSDADISAKIEQAKNEAITESKTAIDTALTIQEF